MDLAGDSEASTGEGAAAFMGPLRVAALTDITVDLPQKIYPSATNIGNTINKTSA